MNETPDKDPTLTDVLEKLNKLSGEVSELSGEVTATPDKDPTLTDVLERLNEVSGDLTELSGEVTDISGEVTQLSGEVKKFDERFSNYQQSTQWVVQLAFGLIASATVIVVVTSVFK